MPVTDCNEEVVRMVVEEGPLRVQNWLIGARFDKEKAEIMI
jgi:hypothetical protein